MNRIFEIFIYYSKSFNFEYYYRLLILNLRFLINNSYNFFTAPPQPTSINSEENRYAEKNLSFWLKYKFYGWVWYTFTAKSSLFSIYRFQLMNCLHNPTTVTDEINATTSTDFLNFLFDELKITFSQFFTCERSNNEKFTRLQ